MRFRFPTRRIVARALLSIALVAPLMGASCADLTGTKKNYDGTYVLVSVDGQGLPYDIIRVDSRNRLSLTRGEWTIVDDFLVTKMWTTSIVNGVATSESRFNPEQHVGDIVYGDGTAEVTLDSGSRIYATLGSGYVVYSASGHELRFEKR